MANAAPEAKIAAFVDLLLRGGLAEPSDLRGCSDEEIARLEAHHGLRLPVVFRAYLARVGNGAGAFMVGSDYLYPELFRLHKTAEVFLAANGGPFTLRPDDFVFLIHHDYRFWWFPTADAGDDPPVFFYSEVDGGDPPILTPLQLADAFSAWLLRTAGEAAVIHARVQSFSKRYPDAIKWRRHDAGPDSPDR